MIRARTHMQIFPVAALAAGLAVVDWRVLPERQPFWILALATVATIWLAVFVLEGRATRSSGKVLSLAMAGVLAELMLVFALAVSLLKTQGLEGWLSQRAFGIFTGLVLAVIGNALPKVVVPLVQGRRTPAQAQALRRLCGWAFTMGGLGYALVWLVSPVGLADTLSMAVCAAVVVIIAFSCLGAFRSPSG